MSEARLTLQPAVDRLDASRAYPRARHTARRDTAELVTGALELLGRAEQAMAGIDGSRS